MKNLNHIFSDDPETLRILEQRETNGLLRKIVEETTKKSAIEIKAEMIKGDKGEDGYTPIKGVDYFDGEKGEKGNKGDTGERGEKGDNGKDGRNGLDGLDGKKGKDGNDGSPDTPTQIVEKINTLDEQIEVKAIKGLPTVDSLIKELKKKQYLEPKDIKGLPINMNDMRWHGSGSAGVTSVSSTSPITSSGGATPNISTSLATNKLVGRGSAGTGVFEAITLGTNLSLTGTTLNATGGTTSPLTTKGDVWGYSTTNARIPVGSNDLPLVADSSQTLGVGYKVLPLAGGGWAISNTRTNVGTGGSITALVASTVWQNFTNSSGGTSLLGVTAQADGTEIIITNSGSTLVIGHQSGSASAANRIICPGSANFQVPLNTSIRLRYDGSVSRWTFVGGYGEATTFQAGLLSSSDKVLVNTISGKLSGSGANGRVTFYNGTNSTTSDSSFVYNTTNKFLGVGTASPSAAGHFSASTATTISGLATVNATLTPFNPFSAPSYSPVQTTPHLNRASAFSSGEIGGSSAYNPGDVLEYQLWASSGGTYSVVSSYTTTTITTGGDDVFLSWNDDAAGTEGVDSYTLMRNVNGGGYNDGIVLGLVTNYDDNSSGWGSVSISPQFPDFVANGSTRNYTAYTKATVNGTNVYSASGTSFPFNDDNSGNAYAIQHSLSPSGRVLNTDNTTYADGGSFVEYTNSPFAGGNTVTPNTYGRQADGSFWNKSYDFYNYSSSLGIYSASSTVSGVTDPNDGQYYYVVCDFTGQISSAKIIRDSTSSETSATSPIYDDGNTGWSGNTTVTPNSVYPSATISESYSVDGKPQHLMKSLDGTTVREEERTSSDTLIGFMNNSNGSKTINGSTNIALAANGTVRVKADTTGLGFFGVTPVAQQGATTDLGVALSNLGVRASGTAYPITTSGAVTLGSLTSTRIPIAGTAGLLGDDADLTFTGGDTLNYTKGVTTLNTYTAGSGGTTSGMQWNDTTQKAMAVYESGVKQMLVGTIFTQTADGTIGNSTTETAISSTGVGTLTLPANLFVAGKTIRVRGWGYHSSATGTIRIKIKFGSTVILDTGANGSLTDTNAGIQILGEITCRTTGASGTVFGQGVYTEYGGTVHSYQMVNTSTTTIDTTASQAITVTAQWGTANSGNTITLTNLTIEVLN